MVMEECCQKRRRPELTRVKIVTSHQRSEPAQTKPGGGVSLRHSLLHRTWLFKKEFSGSKAPLDAGEPFQLSQKRVSGVVSMCCFCSTSPSEVEPLGCQSFPRAARVSLSSFSAAGSSPRFQARYARRVPHWKVMEENIVGNVVRDVEVKPPVIIKIVPKAAQAAPLGICHPERGRHIRESAVVIIVKKEIGSGIERRGV